MRSMQECGRPGQLLGAELKADVVLEVPGAARRSDPSLFRPGTGDLASSLKPLPQTLAQERNLTRSGGPGTAGPDGIYEGQPGQLRPLMAEVVDVGITIRGEKSGVADDHGAASSGGST